MLIKAKVSCAGAGFSLAPGQECEMTDVIANDLIAAGYAETVKPPMSKKQTAAKKTAKKAEAGGND